LNNHGTLTADIVASGAGAQDSVINQGKIGGDVRLGSGDDFFNGAGGSSGVIMGQSGRDTLIGGYAADRLNGGADRDDLTGGLGGDIFDHDALVDSPVSFQRDRITDFKHKQHDRIDLSTIDANSALAGDQYFVFRGTAAFSDAGQVRYLQEGGNTMVYVNVNANYAPEMQVQVNGACPPGRRGLCSLTGAALRAIWLHHRSTSAAASADTCGFPPGAGAAAAPRTAVGVSPKRRRKARLKWDRSLNPHS
jgi:hypothetical protein